MTEREREAFATGADFTELCAISRQEWAKQYQARKRRLQHLLRRGKITKAQYAARIREAAQELGV